VGCLFDVFWEQDVVVVGAVVLAGRSVVGDPIAVDNKLVGNWSVGGEGR
jgi:hypothetical protein